MKKRGQLHAPATKPRKTSPSIHWTVSWREKGTQSVWRLWRRDKSLSDSLHIWPIAKSLYWLSYTGSYLSIFENVSTKECVIHFRQYCEVFFSLYSNYEISGSSSWPCLFAYVKRTERITTAKGNPLNLYTKALKKNRKCILRNLSICT
jgi:hypothetical protein